MLSLTVRKFDHVLELLLFFHTSWQCNIALCENKPVLRLLFMSLLSLIYTWCQKWCPSSDR
mgnify:CR=1 FL=1